MILLKNKDKKANIKIGNNIEIKDGSDFPFDLTLYGRSTQETTTGKNLFNSSNSIWTGNSAGKVNYDSTNDTFNFHRDSGSDYLVANESIKLKANTNDTLYINAISNTMTGDLMYINSSANLTGDNNRTLLTAGQTGIVRKNLLTGNLDMNYDLWLYCNSTGTLKAQIMLVEGVNDTSSYEPYTGGQPSPSPDYPSPIESITEISATVTGKNLLENKTKNSGISKGITFTLNGDGSYTLNGTNDGTGNSTVFLSSSSNPTTLKAGTYYTIPTPNGVHITGAKIGGGYLQLASSSTNQFTLNEDTQAQIYIQVPNGITTTYNNIKVYPMISTTPITQTDYEEYKSNSLTINLQGNELCSLPNGTKDEVNITNGEALLIKRVGKVVLDGSENWAEYVSQTSDGYRVYTTAYRLGLTGTLSYDTFLSNYFQAIPFEQKNSINLTKHATYLNIDNTIANTVAGVKAWLSTHNTEVYYELAEPETINLGTVEMPHTYEGVSNITNSADTEMVVKYYKKFEFDKILRSGYNIDEQEYEIAKKQMANGKRKKILSSYVDCIIKIDLGLLDNKTYQEYKEQLEDGEYEYWSYKYNQYKKANFILTKPSITTEYAYDDDIGIDDMEIILEKSSDIS